MSEPRVDSMVAGDRAPMPAFQGILHSFFDRLDAGEGIVIAFTSATAGEGVTYVSKSVRAQLSASCEGSAHYLSSEELRRDSWSGSVNWLDSFTESGERKPTGAW